jgi:hypothetical protein
MAGGDGTNRPHRQGKYLTLLKNIQKFGLMAWFYCYALHSGVIRTQDLQLLRLMPSTTLPWHQGFTTISMYHSMTRLDEFSPIGQLLAVGCFFENYTSSPSFGAIFPHSIILIWKNMGWATFWATFSQTELVTLM